MAQSLPEIFSLDQDLSTKFIFKVKQYISHHDPGHINTHTHTHTHTHIKLKQVLKTSICLCYTGCNLMFCILFVPFLFYFYNATKIFS